MSASGSLATLGIAELLQVASLFRKVGSLCCTFSNDRVITVFFQEGNLSGLTDSGRVWQLGDLLESMGRLPRQDKNWLLGECRLHGKRLGQLLLEEGYLSRPEMEALLKRIIMQSLLFAVEHEDEGFFELEVGAVSETSLTFPITDFLMEITSAIDEYRRLRELLGPGGGLKLGTSGTMDPAADSNALPYRLVQVLAHVDGDKSAMDVAAASPFSPTETLRALCDLAERGCITWAEPNPTDVRPNASVKMSV